MNSLLENRLFKLDDIMVFDEKAAKKNFFYQTPSTAGAVWCLYPGQKLQAHSHAKADDLWICIKGTGTFFPGEGETATITAGDLIISTPGQVHGVENTGDEPLVFIGVAGPNPLDFIVCPDYN